MEMKKVACAVVFATTSISAVVATEAPDATAPTPGPSSGAVAPAPGPSSGAAALGSMVRNYKM